MAPKKRAVKKLVKKKRKWFPIVASGDFKNSELGQSLVVDATDLKGKTLSTDLGKLTGEMKRQNTHLTFIVNEVKENKGIADLIGYKLSTMYIKRIKNSPKDKIEESFIIKLADNSKYKIKPLVVIKGKTNASVRTALRKGIIEYYKEATKKMKPENLFKEIISSNLQRRLKIELKKLYPVQISEVKFLKKA